MKVSNSYCIDIFDNKIFNNEIQENFIFFLCLRMCPQTLNRTRWEYEATTINEERNNLKEEVGQLNYKSKIWDLEIALQNGYVIYMRWFLLSFHF